MRPRGEKLPAKLLTFRSVGWLLLLGTVITAVGVWRVLAEFGLREDLGPDRFSYVPCLVDREFMVATNLRRHSVRAMSDPNALTVSELLGSPNRKVRKLLVPSDRVVGVVRGGEARAYPLRILDWHEVVNDTLGGEPVAVTYHPLCDSAVVFDRRVGGGTLEFEVSGVLWNSSQLFFAKKEPPGGESLWSQLQARAVTGPDAAEGRTLRVLPCSVVPWETWKRDHPETTVLAPERAYMKLYQRRTYASYEGTRELKFPVPDALYPPPGEGDGWDRVLVVRVDGAERVIGDFGGEPTPDGATEVFHAFRWAWHATRP